jgi:predicted nucleic acid-binding protein
MPRLLDTNLLIRFFTRDDPPKADRVLGLLERVARGSERLVTTPVVVFETVFTPGLLTRQRARQSGPAPAARAAAPCRGG